MKKKTIAKVSLAFGITNSLLIAALGAAAYGVDILNMIPALDFLRGGNENNSVNMLFDNEISGKVLRSYADPEEGSVVTEYEIEAALSQIGELTTAEYNYVGITGKTDPRRAFGFDIPLTDNRVEVAYEGTIRAGYAIDDINREIDNENRIITITLPAVTVFSHEIEDTEVAYENNILNPIPADEVIDLLEDAKEDELEEAIDAGLYEQAEENARAIITDTISSVCDYEIVFETTQELFDSRMVK